MKVVVSATDQTIDAPMDQRFGRAPWFVLVDTESGEWSAHANGAVESGHGAGIEASRAVLGLGAAAIVTGDVGPNAHRTLQAAGVPVYSARGVTVREAVEALKAGTLPQLIGPSAPAHAGFGGAGAGSPDVGMGGGMGRGGMGGGAGMGGGGRGTGGGRGGGMGRGAGMGGGRGTGGGRGSRS